MAALLLPVSLRTIWGSSWSTGLEVAVTLVLLAGHAAVVVRRRAPRVAFAVAAGVAAVLLVAPTVVPSGMPPSEGFSAILLPSVLVFPVVLYSLAAWCPGRTSGVALGLALLGVVLVAVRLWDVDYLTVAQPGWTRPGDPVRNRLLFVVIGAVATVLLPWWAGRYRRLRLLYVAELEDRVRREAEDRRGRAREAVLAERRRIAREMHDVVAHSLSVVVTQAEGARLLAAKDPGVAAQALDTIARVGREAMHDMGCALQVLDDPPEDGSAGPAQSQPQPGLAQLPALVEQVRESGLPVALEVSGGAMRLSGAAELTVYRVVQEALTNVLKHAGPRAMTLVTLTWTPAELEVRVSNDTDGRTAVAPGSGRGLRGMADRLAAVGGSMRVTDRPDRFGIEARIPLAEGVAR